MSRHFFIPFVPILSATVLGFVAPACGGNVRVDATPTTSANNATGRHSSQSSSRATGGAGGYGIVSTATSTCPEGTWLGACGDTGGSGGSVSTSLSRCPLEEPTFATDCSVSPSVTCMYNATACCDSVCCGADQYWCNRGAWELASGDCPEPSQPPCPASVPDAGDSCNPCDYQEGCQYPDGACNKWTAWCSDAGTWFVGALICLH